MDEFSREKFWSTLCALEGKNVRDDAALLNSTIQVPRHLYRFRTVSFNSLDCLQNNKLFFSSANYYDDPFDSFLQIDNERVYSNLNILQSYCAANLSQTEKIASSLGVDSSDMIQVLSNADMQSAYLNISRVLEQINKIVQSEIQSICFTEEYKNEQLWLKYAGNHTGFVLEYDMMDNDAFLCGRKSMCRDCLASTLNYPLYPVYYTTQKYDATNFAVNTAIVKAISHFPQPVQAQIMQYVAPSNWERERVTLVKKKCHEHDEEWRMLYTGPAGGRPYICWRPSSVTLGLKMQIAKRNLVVSLAKLAGIPVIYECYIKSGELDRRIIS